MLEFLQEYKEILIKIVVPVLVAIIGLLGYLFQKSTRSQKIGDIKGNNNTVINGDIKSSSRKN